MSEVSHYVPGQFCWIEIGTTDAAASREFYTKLLGWQAEDAYPGANYTRLRRNGKDVAGLYALTPEQRARGVPAHWLSYVAVESADDGARKAASLGGKVVRDAFEVPNIGRMALVQDPTGARLALWQSKGHIGSGLVGEPGSPCWNELNTTDTRAATKFYTSLFDWRAQEEDMGPTKYTMFLNGGRPSGGMLEMTEEWGGVSPHWMAYIAVEDCATTVSRVEALGGTILARPADVPGVGRFAVLEDPQGAAFAVICLHGKN